MNLMGKLLLLPLRCFRGLMSISLRLTGWGAGAKSMDGIGYEQFVAEYLREHGFRNVKHTGATGDFGVDIVARKRGLRYAVQCKYYSGSVSGAAVQEAVAGSACYHCDKAMVITNSRLTKGARKLAEANHVLVIEGLEPDQVTVASLAVPGRIISLAICVILSVLWIPKLRTGSATGADVYVLIVLLCYLIPRTILMGLSWLWQQFSRRNRKTP